MWRATTVAFTEGPAVDADGCVYFTDIANDRILRLAPDGTRTTFREPCGRTNGQAFGRDGLLYHCEGAELGPGGRRRVTRTDLRSGAYEVVVERYEGRRFNSPNDICADGLGRLYFSDPRYGSRDDLELDVEGVYRVDPDGAVVRIIGQPEVERPNGVAVTQDGRCLYVVDTGSHMGGARKVWAFALDAAGDPHDQRLVRDFAPGRGADGLALDREGTLYVAAGITLARGPQETTDVPAAVHVMTPQGVELRRIPIPEDVVTNVAFGGPDGRTLYVTAGKTLFATHVPVPGQVAHPAWRERRSGPTPAPVATTKGVA